MTKTESKGDFRAQAMAIMDNRFCTASLSHPAMVELYAIALVRMKEYLEKNFRPPENPRDSMDSEKYLSIKLSACPLGPLEAAGQRIKLPALPKVWIDLQELMNDPEASATEIAKVIKYDPKLTTSLLNLVNSAMFGLPSKVDTLPRAVTIVGSRQISIMALGSLLISMFQDLPPDVIDIKDFWKHSISCAILSHNLAVAAGKEEPERFFVAGLIHDIGRLSLFSVNPDLAQVALSLEYKNDITLDEAERRVFDFDHAMLGALIFKRWNLPESLVLTALNHHSAEKCTCHEVASVVHVANIISLALGLGAAREEHVGPMSLEAWEALNMGPTDLHALIAGHDEQLSEVFKVLIG